MATKLTLRRVGKDFEPAYCPVCGEQVTDLTSDTEIAWVLKDEYAGVPGLPVGEMFGRQVPVATYTRVQPCGHFVDEIEWVVVAPTCAVAGCDKPGVGEVTGEVQVFDSGLHSVSARICRDHAATFGSVGHLSLGLKNLGRST